MKIEIEVGDEAAALLKVLAGDKEPADALRQLVHHATDGVRRPGSWERPWVCQVFPEEYWSDRVEPDPDTHWQVRPVQR